jgi:hypothetical protein
MDAVTKTHRRTFYALMAYAVVSVVTAAMALAGSMIGARIAYHALFVGAIAGGCIGVALGLALARRISAGTGSLSAHIGGWLGFAAAAQPWPPLIYTRPWCQCSASVLSGSVPGSAHTWVGRGARGADGTRER